MENREKELYTVNVLFKAEENLFYIGAHKAFYMSDVSVD